MMMESLIFDVLALLTLCGAGLVLFRRSPLAATLGLFLAVTACTGLYGLASVGFPGIMQFVVFVSIITVLLVFVFMLLNVHREEFGQRRHAVGKALSIVLVSIIAVRLVGVILKMPVAAATPPEDSGSLETVGMLLFSRYLLPFGLMGFILLSAVVSAAVVAGRKA